METLKQLWLDCSPMVINFGIAMAVLQAFYLIACVALAILRRVMKKTDLDDRLMQTFGLKEDFPIENAAAANLARVAILLLAGAMALRQIGVADDIISLAFGITLGAIGIGAALAIGLGSEELAGREVEGFLGKIRGD